jgi:hypothetical protein
MAQKGSNAFQVSGYFGIPVFKLADVTKPGFGSAFRAYGTLAMCHSRPPYRLAIPAFP